MLLKDDSLLVPTLITYQLNIMFLNGMYLLHSFSKKIVFIIIDYYQGVAIFKCLQKYSLKLGS